MQDLAEDLAGGMLSTRDMVIKEAVRQVAEEYAVREYFRSFCSQIPL